MACVIFPMVFLSHRALSCFVLQASGDDQDITCAAEEYFGRKISLFIAVLYFFAIFPICLAYCVGITNTFESFIYNQFLPLLNVDSVFAQWLSSIYQINIDVNGKKIIALSPFYRAILVFVLVSIFMFIMLFSEEIITKICEWLVYPLCIILFAFSLYLIPHWSFDFTTIPNTKEFLTIIWLTLPVFSFFF